MALSKTHRYFTEFTISKALLYTVATLYVATAAVIVMLQPFLTVPCTYTPDGTEPETLNSMYKYNPCRFQRYSILLGLTQEECEFGRRLVWAVVLGCLIGWERKQADRPAGIRTMALVSLGSCLFSICSAFAFLSGPMAWDASRVSAAIPSGVGFLGSALIFKHKDDETNVHEVHGLTTAASVWLSAAVGIACAGGMYFVASLSTAIMLVLLRFGPRTNFPPDDDDDEVENMGGLSLEVDEAIANVAARKKNYDSTSSELGSLLQSPQKQHSERSHKSTNRRPSAIGRPSLI